MKKRAPVYGDDVREKVLLALASGRSLNKTCAEDGMPAPSTVVLWTHEDPTFAERYARAKEIGLTLKADELLDIADDGSRDTYTDEKGNEHVDVDVVQRSRLRVDTRKWLLSKMLPKLYGERSALELTGKDGGPVEARVLFYLPKNGRDDND